MGGLRGYNLTAVADVPNHLVFPEVPDKFVDENTLGVHIKISYVDVKTEVPVDESRGIPDFSKAEAVDCFYNVYALEAKPQNADESLNAAGGAQFHEVKIAQLSISLGALADVTNYSAQQKNDNLTALFVRGLDILCKKMRDSKDDKRRRQKATQDIRAAAVVSLNDYRAASPSRPMESADKIAAVTQRIRGKTPVILDSQKFIF